MRYVLAVSIVLWGLGATGQTKPYINSISPVSAAPSETVTISGSGFSSNTSEWVVFFGSAIGAVTNSTTSIIEVTVPVGATYDAIHVINISSGFSASSSQMFSPSWGSTSLPASYPFNPIADIATNINQVYDLCLCDFDNDGLNDVVVTAIENPNSGKALRQVYRNTSSGSSTTLSKVLDLGSKPAFHVACKDLDGDGKPDLVATQNNDDGDAGKENIEIYRNTSVSGTISFATVEEIEVPNTDGGDLRPPARIEISDIDQDGKPDLIISNDQANDIDIYLNGSSSGNISFTHTAQLAIASNQRARSIKVGDLNNDNLPEVVIGSFEASDIYVFHNQSTTGNVKFADAINVPPNEQNNIKNISIADLDNDGYAEIIATEGEATASNGEMMIIPNNTTGTGETPTFGSIIDVATGALPWGISVGDVNGDDQPDVALAMAGADQVEVFFNTSSGDGSYSFSRQVVSANNNARNIKVGDLNGDGKPELAMTTKSVTETAGELSIVDNAACLTPEISPASGSFCTGVEFILTASPALGTTYKWEISRDGGNSFVEDASVTGNTYDISSETTNVLVRVSAITTQGCDEPSTNYTFGNSNLGDPGTPTISTSTSPVCAGTSFNLTSSVSADNYSWSGPNGFTSTASTVAISSPTSADAGTYSLTVSNDGGCESKAGTLLVEVNSAPLPNISNNNADLFCLGESATLIYTPFDGYTYQWARNGSNISGETGTTYTATTSGDYTVVVSDGAGCEFTGTAYTLKQADPPSSTIVATEEICVDVETQFEASVNSSDSDLTAGFSWNFTDENGNSVGNSTAQTTQISFANAGTNTATLVTSYVELSSCNSTTSSTITSSDIPNVDVITPDGIEKCPSDSLRLELPQDFVIYNWSTGDTDYFTYGKTEFGESNETVTVAWTDDIGCAGSSQVTFNNYANSGISITSTLGDITDGELLVPIGQEPGIPLSANGGEPGGYLWTPTNIVDDSAAAEVKVYPRSADQEIILYGTDSNGCYESDSVNIITQHISARKSFSPNGDGLGFECWEIVNAATMTECSVYIFDDRGRELLVASDFTDDCVWDGTVNGNEAPEGIYYYVIKCGSDNINQPTGSILLAR